MPEPTKAQLAAQVEALRKSLEAAEAERRRLEDALTQALEQQTATTDILRVIASSPTDYQPVFNTIVARAGVVCGAVDAILWTVDGDELVARAHHGPLHAVIGARQPIQGSVAGYAVREARTVQVEDLTEADDFPVGRDIARRLGLGWRTTLSTPLVRDGIAIGAILIRRNEVCLFTEKQIGLLQTFADQAVIAIENVRLFTELQQKNEALTQAHAQVTEALEQQTATSEILRAISQSPTDVQPVVDTIVRNAARLCGASQTAAAVCLARDGFLHLDAANRVWMTAEALEGFQRFFPLPISPHIARTLRGETFHIADITHNPAAPETMKTLARHGGYESMVWVPLMRGDEGLGLLSVTRATPGPFDENQIAVLRNFAHQAVIAIENVRLFRELQTSNRELTTALDTQTATADILSVISRSQTDVQPVFDTIVQSAVRLLRAHSGMLTRIAGERLELAAFTSIGDTYDTAMKTFWPRPLNSKGIHILAIRGRAPVNIADVPNDPRVPEDGRAVVGLRGILSVVSVPLLRHDEAIGTVAVNRLEAGGFTDDEIVLLKTFADQAVIAIENVRLFTELQRSNRELTTALDTQTATADILRVISGSRTDVQPVFETIVASAKRLLEARSASVLRLVESELRLAAFTPIDADADAALQRVYPRPVEDDSPNGIAARERVPFMTPDARTDARVGPLAREAARARGYHAMLIVPMVRKGDTIGTINVSRATPGPFADKDIALLQTFADQAVIAIENVRLFNELEARTQELTRSVDELTALGEVSRALSSTLDLETVLQTIVTRAVQITGTAGCNIWEYDEHRVEFRLRASHYADHGDIALLQAPGRVTTIPRGQGVTTQVIERREPVQIADIAIEGSYESPIRRSLIEAGHRALLGVPLLSEDEVVGVLAVTRKTPGAFEPEIVRLLSTFATQSALAIQNARLFLEIEDKSRQLEAASQHKSEFLANMSHELRTPLNAVIGFSDVLLQGMFGDMTEKQTEYLQDILASGQHLLSLINDILDLSKIEAGRMDLDLAEFHLPAAIDDALLLMRERASRRGLTLERQVDERLGEIRADQRKVKQVLLNLLSNAVKFTPEGGRIDVRAALVDGSVEMSVTDTGIGIAPEDQEAVFEEFRQVGKAEKKAEGTGLGLALCRKFVELHGGRIWVKSKIGAGSTFTFSVPLIS